VYRGSNRDLLLHLLAQAVTFKRSQGARLTNVPLTGALGHHPPSKNSERASGVPPLTEGHPGRPGGDQRYSPNAESLPQAED